MQAAAHLNLGYCQPLVRLVFCVLFRLFGPETAAVVQHGKVPQLSLKLVFLKNHDSVLTTNSFLRSYSFFVSQVQKASLSNIIPYFSKSTYSFSESSFHWLFHEMMNKICGLCFFYSVVSGVRRGERARKSFH